jgi:hypothetical protein
MSPLRSAGHRWIFNARLARQNGGLCRRPFRGSFAVDPIEQGVSSLCVSLSLWGGGGSTPPARQDASVVRGFWECRNTLHLLSHSPLSLSPSLVFFFLATLPSCLIFFLVSNLRFPSASSETPFVSVCSQ